MSNLKQEEVEKAAASYIKSTGVAPFIVDGSEFDDTESPPVWRVYISFCERLDEWVGLPNSLVIDVDDATGKASHIPSL